MPALALVTSSGSLAGISSPVSASAARRGTRPQEVPARRLLVVGVGGGHVNTLTTRAHPLQAATIGHAALDTAGPIRSHRTAEELRELARYATTHQHLDEVAHLRHRIATLVCTDSP
jgi:hypothetical protein